MKKRMADWSDYRTEILLAINQHSNAAEQAAQKAENSNVLMYCNKCLALLQFGLEVNLINDKEWREGYERLTIIVKSIECIE